jgi:DNA polymerase sigma
MTSTRSEGVKTVVEMIEIESMTGEDIERLMTADINMREKIAALEKQIKEIKEERVEGQAILIEACRILKSDSLKNEVGTLTRRVKKRYWTTDWPSMYKFIKEKDLIEFMEKRLNQTNIKEYIAENPDELPPGLSTSSEYTVSIRKNRSYEEKE